MSKLIEKQDEYQKAREEHLALRAEIAALEDSVKLADGERESVLEDQAAELEDHDAERERIQRRHEAELVELQAAHKARREELSRKLADLVRGRKRLVQLAEDTRKLMHADMAGILGAEPEPTRQSIEGNGNVQVGGDVVL